MSINDIARRASKAKNRVREAAKQPLNEAETAKHAIQKLDDESERHYGGAHVIGHSPHHREHFFTTKTDANQFAARAHALGHKVSMPVPFHNPNGEYSDASHSVHVYVHGKTGEKLRKHEMVTDAMLPSLRMDEAALKKPAAPKPVQPVQHYVNPHLAARARRTPLQRHEAAIARTRKTAGKLGENRDVLLAARSHAEAEHKAASAALAAHPRGPNGMTPDHVKATPEYRRDKARFAAAHEALRHVNGLLSKHK